MENGVSYARLEMGGTERFVPLRQQLGVTSFGMNLMLLHPGARGRIRFPLETLARGEGTRDDIAVLAASANPTCRVASDTMCETLASRSSTSSDRSACWRNWSSTSIEALTDLLLSSRPSTNDR